MEINFNHLEINSLIPQNQFEEKVKAFLTEWFSATDTVLVQTSGSTGEPKILQAEKSKMQSSAKMTCDFLGLKANDTALLCLPVEYISGKMMVVRSTERKLKLVVKEPSLKPIKYLDIVVDFCAMTPLQVENSLDKIYLVRKLIIGGAAVSELLKNKIRTSLQDSGGQTTIYETYGMSETLSHIALKEIFPHEEHYFSVLDDVEISQDERGSLKINAPQLNSEILQTNDIVEIINSKQFQFLGRADNIINSGGAKIYPEQLEKLVKQDITNEVVFLGIPDDSLGQKLVLVVEGKESGEIKSRLEGLNFEKSFHKPKAVIFAEELPRTPNGKINRMELLNMLTNGFSFNI